MERMVTVVTIIETKETKRRITGNVTNIDVQNPRNAKEKRLLKGALDALPEKERSDFLAVEKRNPFKFNPDYQNLIRKLEKFKKSENKNDLDYAIKKISKNIKNYRLLYGKNKAELFCEQEKDKRYFIRYGYAEKNLFELVKIQEILMDRLTKIKKLKKEN